MSLPSLVRPFDPASLPTTGAGYVRRYLRVYLIGGLFLAGFQLAMNRIDWMSKSTVDRIFSPAFVAGGVLVLGLSIIGLGILAFVLRLASRWFLFNAGRDVEYELRGQLLHKLHRLGTSFYRRFSPGEIMTRSTSDLGQVRLLYGFGVLNLVNVIFAFASALQVMVRISPRLTGAAFVTLPFLVLLTRLFSKRFFLLTRKSQTELGHLGDLAQRHFAGIRVVRSFAIEDFAESRFAEASNRYLDASLALARTRGGMFPALGAINAMSLLIVAWYGAYLLQQVAPQGGISKGDFFAFLLAWTRMAWPMTSFGLTLAILQRGRACFQRIREILEMQPDVIEPAGASTNKVVPTGLRVDKLHYQIGERAILKDVSFEVPAGESLAIVGRTGSGKSTLAMLLVRLLPTPRGSVFLDDRDVCDLDRVSLRERVGYAQQDPFLFSSSVADNVAIGLEVEHGASLPHAELDAALRDAQIADEVAHLPNGVQTLVGERGVQLSGGQRQRVALARALVSHTPLLVLDDPLSAVDARTEAAILDALRRRGELRSIVLITNRIAAAARCNRILVLDEGRVTQSGTHAELIKQAGLYGELAEEQRVEGELEALGATTSVAEDTPAATPGAARTNAEDDAPRGTDLRLLFRLWPFLRDQRATIIAALVLLAALIATSLLRPLAMGGMTTAATSHNPLLRPGLWLFAVLASTHLLTYGQVYLTQLAGARAMITLRMHVFRFTDRLGMRMFDRTPVGRLVTRVVNDVEAIGEMFAFGVFNALGDLVSLIGIVAMMMALDWQLSLIAFAALPATALIVAFIRRGARQAYRDTRTTTAQLNSMLNEQITGVAVVQAFGREASMAAAFDVTNRLYRDANKRAILAESTLDAAVEMVQTICIASVLLWSGHVRGVGGVVTFAAVITFQQYLRQFFEPISLLTQRYTVLQSALASSERVFQLLDTTELEPLESTAGNAPVSPGELPASTESFALEHVSFAYRPGRPVLSDVSLAAHQGERIALVGPTGAGKSTITQLLLRLYDTDEGQVRVLGKPVLSMSRRELRRSFSVVAQEVTLFSGTLLENIALGDPEPDRARAEAALDRLGLRETFLNRGDGLDARVDERGLNFSVGERQLLAFARAVYHDGPILLLDEATASIDSHTEARIQRALETLLTGRTALVIAHRLSTIEGADRILVFQAGRIVESGRHAELLAQNGLYARLHALQVAKAQITSAA